jgi:hypothetical protein
LKEERRGSIFFWYYITYWKYLAIRAVVKFRFPRIRRTDRQTTPPILPSPETVSRHPSFKALRLLRTVTRPRPRVALGDCLFLQTSVAKGFGFHSSSTLTRSKLIRVQLSQDGRFQLGCWTLATSGRLPCSLFSSLHQGHPEVLSFFFSQSSRPITTGENFAISHRARRGV